MGIALACPRDHLPLQRSGGELKCADGHSYRVRCGIPIFLLPEVPETHSDLLRRATDEAEITAALAMDDGSTPPASDVHFFVKAVAGGTSGYMFDAVRDRLPSYPIPDIRLPDGSGEILLDIGCNWGRWSISAARKGYSVIGIDPCFEALVVARRVCRQLGVEAEFICADARFLPFAPNQFDVAYSYSVIQHFSRENARIAIAEIGRILKPGGNALVQMPNRFGLRCIYHQLRRIGRPEASFDVRYWAPQTLLRTFTKAIGPSSITIDGFFGLGMQSAGSELLKPHHRAIVRTSEFLRRFNVLAPVADSLFLHSRKP